MDFFSKKVHYTKSFYDTLDGLISLDFLHKVEKKSPFQKKIKFIYISRHAAALNSFEVLYFQSIQLKIQNKIEQVKSFYNHIEFYNIVKTKNTYKDEKIKGYKYN